MKRRILPLACLLLAAVIFLGGCGAAVSQDYFNGKSEDMAADAEYPMQAETSAAQSFELDGADSNTALSDSRKLIKTVSLSFETEAFDAFTETVDRSAAACGGYIEQSEVSGGSRSKAGRFASYTVRIPVNRLEEFSSEVSTAGVITNKTSSQEDVTLTYVDIEAHITALQTERESLLRLLEQAESIEDIISIQDRIAGVQYELESYTSRLRTYDNLIDYATIHLYVSEVEYEEEIVESPSVWAQIGKNLKNAVRYLGKFFRGLFVFLVSALPYLAVVAVISLPILYFTVFRPARKRKKARKEQDKP